MRRLTLFAVIVSVTCLLLAGPTAAAETWQVGVAKTSITPKHFMWMAGYASRKQPADSKETELWAKAIVLEDADKNRGVLITLDLIGVDRDLALPLRQKIADRMELGLSQVMICCSHTHSGPVVAENLRPMHYLILDEHQRKLVDDYAQSLERAVMKVVEEAEQRLAPAVLLHASGTCSVAVNRRTNQEAEVPALRQMNALKGPSDQDVPVLAVKNEVGELVAMVFGYACHATVLDGYAWSGDYPAYAQMALEARHPSATALFWAGCGGDQNPLPRRRQALAQKYGEQLADAVDAALRKDAQPINPKLAASYKEVALPLATLPSRDELRAQARDSNIYLATRATYLLADLDAGRSLSETSPYPIGVWKLGQEIDWIFLGGEVVVDYAVRLKAEERDKQTWVAAYANDVMAYIPSRRVLAEGGYEGGGAMVYYGLPTVWKETVEATIVEAVYALKQAKQ